MEARVTRRMFDVGEYHRMVEAGILTEDDRIELIEGEIVKTSPIGSRHRGCVNRLARLLHEFAGRDYIVEVQGPIRLGEYSEPEPDLALLRFREDFYSESHPAPEDALLVIEVSETPAAYNKGVKLPLYASTGVREMWIIDLSSRSIEVHSNPRRSYYETIAEARPGQPVESATIPGLSPAADDVLDRPAE